MAGIEPTSHPQHSLREVEAHASRSTRSHEPGALGGAAAVFEHVTTGEIAQQPELRLRHPLRPPDEFAVAEKLAVLAVVLVGVRAPPTAVGPVQVARSPDVAAAARRSRGSRLVHGHSLGQVARSRARDLLSTHSSRTQYATCRNASPADDRPRCRREAVSLG